MVEIAVRVEKRAGKQSVSILERHHLAAMKMPGQNQVVATMTGGIPDTWIVGAKDLDVTVWQGRGFGAGHGDYSGTVRHASGSVMNPSPPAAFDRVANSMHADPSVVVPAHSQDRRDLVQRGDQIAKLD
jgi:hypothetical protein